MGVSDIADEVAGAQVILSTYYGLAGDLERAGRYFNLGRSGLLGRTRDPSDASCGARNLYWLGRAEGTFALAQGEFETALGHFRQARNAL